MLPFHTRNRTMTEICQYGICLNRRISVNKHLIPVLAIVVLVATFSVPVELAAQQAAGSKTPFKVPLTLDGKPDISGVWAGPGFKHIPGAKFPDVAAAGAIRFNREDYPFRPGGKELWNFKFNGDPRHDDPTLYCLPIGMPYIGLTARAQQIFQPPGYLVFVYEDNHMPRIIHMDGRPHPKNLEPTWMGNSVGHYEGDTAVIDTIGLKEWGSDGHGHHMHSDAVHYIERIKRTGPDTATYELITDDPKIFTKPWSAGPWDMHLRNDWEILEDVCEENNLDPDLIEKLPPAK
jgi:hypothetical protein